MTTDSHVPEPDTDSVGDAMLNAAPNPAPNAAPNAASALATDTDELDQLYRGVESDREIGGESDAEADAQDDVGDGESQHSSHIRAFIDWVVVIAIALFVAFLVRGFVLAHFVVDGHSMESTLSSGDRVFVNKLSYRLHDPNRGDVVVLHQISGTSERDLIKRVIALPGETIEGDGSCAVFIDGRRLTEPYLDPEVVQPGTCGSFGPLAVGDEQVFVMGDNRNGSQDSRSIGPIAYSDLVGRAFVVFWPQQNWQWL